MRGPLLEPKDQAQTFTFLSEGTEVSSKHGFMEPINIQSGHAYECAKKGKLTRGLV